MTGNVIGSLFSGFGHVIGNIFGSQLGFLSGKSCSTVCGPTWDFTCYIENFCLEQLLKFFAVCLLSYVVLLFLYLLYKLGVYQCLCRSLCKMVWACLSAFFSTWEHGCHLLCHMLFTVKRQRRRDIEMLDRSDVEDTYMGSSFSYQNEGYRNSGSSRRRRSSYHKRDNHLRRLLKPRNHRVRVGVDGDSVHKRKHVGHGDIRVFQTSRLVRRGRNHKRSRHGRKKRT